MTNEVFEVLLSGTINEIDYSLSCANYDHEVGYHISSDSAAKPDRTMRRSRVVLSESSVRQLALELFDATVEIRYTDSIYVLPDRDLSPIEQIQMLEKLAETLTLDKHDSCN